METNANALGDAGVLLAGVREVRIVGSTREAQSELARGFRPAVVVLGAGVREAAGHELTRHMERHPSQAAIPVLALSGDADRVRLRLVSRNEEVQPPGPDQLEGLLALLEDFLAGGEPARPVAAR
jgi:CheY-like chemotaxis protein